MRKSRWLGICAGIIALSVARIEARVHLPRSELVTDVRCVIIGIKLAGMTDVSRQSAGTMLTLYYIGRLEGRAPKVDLEDLIFKEIKTMEPGGFDSEARRCGQGLADKARQLTQMKKDMVERERGISGYPAPAAPPLK